MLFRSQLKTTIEIVDHIVAKSGNQDFNYALLSKMGYAFPYYLVENKHYFEIKDRLTEQLFVVCVPHPDVNCNPINNPEWSIAAFGWAKIDQQWEINGIKIFKLIHNEHGKSN